MLSCLKAYMLGTCSLWLLSCEHIIVLTLALILSDLVEDPSSTITRRCRWESYSTNSLSRYLWIGVAPVRCLSYVFHCQLKTSSYVTICICFVVPGWPCKAFNEYHYVMISKCMSFIVVAYIATTTLANCCESGA